jgi:hypothetical protein
MRVRKLVQVYLKPFIPPQHVLITSEITQKEERGEKICLKSPGPPEQKTIFFISYSSLKRAFNFCLSMRLNVIHIME